MLNLVASSGTYLKTACLLDLYCDYATALNMCKRNGMRLFIIDSAATQTTFLTSLQLMANQTTTIYRIAGKRDVNGKENNEWFIPGGPALYKNLRWIEGCTILPCMDSLIVSNTYFPLNKFNKTSFSIDGILSLSTVPFACEVTLK